MSNAREAHRRARRDLHEDRAIPALYIAPSGAAPRPVMVRVLTKFDALGAKDAAAMADTSPRIIFDRLEVAMPERQALLSVEPEELYRLGASKEPDGEFITVSVVKLSAAQIAELYPQGQPVPCS